MGWLEALLGHTVGLDTAPLIYYLELHPTYLPLVDPFFAAVERGDVQGVTSTVTLIEVLTQPLRQGMVSPSAVGRDSLCRSGRRTFGEGALPGWVEGEDNVLARNTGVEEALRPLRRAVALDPDLPAVNPGGTLDGGGRIRVECSKALCIVPTAVRPTVVRLHHESGQAERVL